LTSLINKLTYSSASFSAALLLQFYQSKAQFFYVVELELSPTYYAFAIGIWAIYNSINDPLAGWIQDRKVTRWGRRLPWMIAFWIPLVLSFGLIWAPPSSFISNQSLLFVWLVIALLLFDTGYTVVILAWAALFPELYTTSSERNIVSAFRQLFSLIAMVVALIIPPMFITDGDIPSYAAFGWLLAGISFINLGLSFFGCKETHYKEIKEEDKYSIKEGISLVFTNRNYQVFLFANLVTYFGYGQVLAFLPFFRKFILLKDEGFETLAYAAAIGVTIFALFFWVKVTNKKSPKFTFIWSAAAFSVMLVPLWFLTDPTLILIVMGGIGLGLAGLLMVVDLLISDVIDEDYLNTGKRREGIFFGFNGFFIRIAILLQAISLAIVSKLTGFNEKSDTQTSLGQTGIKFQMVILPIIAFIVSIFLLNKYYDLDGEKLARLHKDIDNKNNGLDPQVEN
jgi:GPH family glycoside/pentoside/hexuronide:cation symporter